MRRPGGLLLIAWVAAVLVLIGLTAGTLGHHDDPTTDAADTAAVPASGAGPSAAVVSADRVPGLRGRPAQRDVEQSSPSVRAYDHSHRLLRQLPQSFGGVSFDSAGRTPSGRVVVLADPHGLPQAEVRAAYRRRLRRARGRMVRVAGASIVAHVGTVRTMARRHTSGGRTAKNKSAAGSGARRRRFVRVRWARAVEGSCRRPATRGDAPSRAHRRVAPSKPPGKAPNATDGSKRAGGRRTGYRSGVV